MLVQSVDEIVAVNAPLILPDTCILLDILRSPRRENIDAQSIRSAQAILEAIKPSGTIASVIAGQVSDELNDNKAGVLKDTGDSLRKLQTELHRINGWSQILGVAGHADMTHGLNAVASCDAILTEWVDSSFLVGTTDELTGFAHRRMMQRITPAKLGKDSFKDCLVVETYLKLAKDIRARGHSATIVFASSNTAEFIERPSSQLYGDIASEFTALGIEYARALHEAAYQLKLPVTS